jgi:hypothetical protein
LFLLMGVRSGILGDCSSSFNTSRSLTKSSSCFCPIFLAFRGDY